MRRGLHLDLTTREVTVLRWMSIGATTRSVAENLGVSPETVKRHLLHIRQKLGARNTTHAVAIGIRRDLI